MNGWDLGLIVIVSVMGTAVAYLRRPAHKAFILMLPIPFTLAALSVGQPVDATNVLGFGVLFLFSAGVWFLHARRRWPIVPAILLCALGYCLLGAGIARLGLTGERAFWSSAAAVLAAGVLLIRGLPRRAEPHHRTPLPVWIKLPAIALVITAIVLIKHELGGFMTSFPMVGTVAAYEGRHSLWTIQRRIAWVMLLMTPVAVFLRLTQARWGLPAALAAAWPLYLALLWLTRKQYTEDDPAAGAATSAAGPRP